MATRKPMIGSISHGTLRTADLISAFEGELDYLGHSLPQSLIDDLHVGLIMDSEGEIRDGFEESAEAYLAELVEALESLAPDYCYFGSIEGDGSDFGFWPDMDLIHEIIDEGERDDAGDVINDSEGVRIVISDHGNIGIYALSDGREMLAIV